MNGSIEYGRLGMSDVTDKLISDVNALLKELSETPNTVTVEDVYVMLGDGTFMFSAVDTTSGHTVGSVLLATTKILMGHKWWIEDLMVLKAYQREGIATRLMGMAEDFARKAGAKNLNLTSSRRRTEARALYLGRGYEQRESDLFRLNF